MMANACWQIGEVKLLSYALWFGVLLGFARMKPSAVVVVVVVVVVVCRRSSSNRCW